MDTKEIKLDNGTILKPVEPLLSDERMKKFSEMMNSLEYQNYAANQMQNQIYKNLKRNNIPQIENPVVTELKTANIKIDELSNQLDYSNTQLKQANDKISSQNLYIKELKTDLKEETEKRVLAENKLGSKDWKALIIGAILGALATEIIPKIVVWLQHILQI